MHWKIRWNLYCASWQRYGLEECVDAPDLDSAEIIGKLKIRSRLKEIVSTHDDWIDGEVEYKVVDIARNGEYKATLE